MVRTQSCIKKILYMLSFLPSFSSGVTAEGPPDPTAPTRVTDPGPGPGLGPWSERSESRPPLGRARDAGSENGINQARQALPWRPSGASDVRSIRYPMYYIRLLYCPLGIF